jgi:hypothetical protein
MLRDYLWTQTAFPRLTVAFYTEAYLAVNTRFASFSALCEFFGAMKPLHELGTDQSFAMS